MRWSERAGLWGWPATSAVRVRPGWSKPLKRISSARRRGVIVPAEIAEFEELEGDLVQGFEVVNGAIAVPNIPGLGVSLNV